MPNVCSCMLYIGLRESVAGIRDWCVNRKAGAFRRLILPPNVAQNSIHCHCPKSRPPLLYWPPSNLVSAALSHFDLEVSIFLIPSKRFVLAGWPGPLFSSAVGARGPPFF